MLNAIEIKGLVKEYPGFRLDGLDLTLDDGLDGGLEKLLDTGTGGPGGQHQKGQEQRQKQ